MANISTRRWLCFGLPTVFAAFTAIAVWLGWNASIVHQRKALLASLDKDGCYSIANHDDFMAHGSWDVSYSMFDVYAAAAVGHATRYTFHQPVAPFEMPSVRRWMGDELRWLIAYRPGPDLKEVQRVFPATLLLLVEPKPGE